MTRDNVDGVLLLDKPPGMTSNAALQVAKRLLGAKKAGHGGTLDPLATGLLPICFGEATKFAGVLLDGNKTYAAELRLGVTTATGDAEGTVLERRPVKVTDDEVGAALASFVGSHDQVPPAYSALKHRGRPLYDYARAGIEAPRAPRRVCISALVMDGREGDCIRFSVTCSKGTYIRSLAEDIGARLGCGAHLSALRRVASGAFQLFEAVTLDDLAGMELDDRRARLVPPDAPLSVLPEVVLDSVEATRLQQGQCVGAPRPIAMGLVRIYALPRQFIGLGEIVEEGRLVSRRLVATASQRLSIQRTRPTLPSL